MLLLLFACSGAQPPVLEEAEPAPVAEAAPIPAPAQEPSPDPSPEPAAKGMADCSAGAVVSDPDPAGLNVRDAPKGAVVGQLPLHTMVQITEASGSWMKIEDAWSAEHEELELPDGWVHGSMLTTFLKTPDEYGPDTKPVLREGPETGSASTPIPYDKPSAISVVGCSREFLRVDVKVGDSTSTGWLGFDSHCPNTVTNCS
jgi:hypothetical protein